MRKPAANVRQRLKPHCSKMTFGTGEPVPLLRGLNVKTCEPVPLLRGLNVKTCEAMPSRRRSIRASLVGDHYAVVGLGFGLRVGFRLRF